MDKELGTYIDGIGSTEDLDSSGERISLDGIDISSLPVDSVFNWEHKAQTSSQIVGKVLEAKKIFKESDCENERHKYFWNKAGKKPYLYVVGVLFDKFGHSGAQDVVAMLKFDQVIDKDKTKQTIGFSIEGSKLDKKGNVIKKCIARKITITNLPCNKVCLAEILEDPTDTKKITKESLFDIFKKTEALETDLKKNSTSKENTMLPKPKRTLQSNKIKPKDKILSGDRISYPKRPKTGKDIYNDPKTFKAEKTKQLKKKKKKKLNKFYSSNVHKALAASCGTGGAPSSLNGMSALSKEHLHRTMKSISDDAFDKMEKKEELVKFLTEKMPKLSKKEILAIAKTVAYVREKKLEKALKDLTESKDE